jgi:hexosaminidase
MKPIVILALVTLAASAAQPEGSLANDLTAALLPPPSSVTPVSGTLTLTREASIKIDPACAEVGSHFAARLRRGTGWPVLAVDPATITLDLVPGLEGVSPEAYNIRIGGSGVVIQSATPAGIARGTETLMQLMPPAVYGPNACDSILLPCLTIEDAPQFAWRGAMLDVSRKFQDKDTVLKLLDGLAACKLNIFHWHLTDDQGWRLPIEGYPKLTEKGPAYSRADIREVVERAAVLGITVVPEIDMPGHSGASCRAYPEISTLNEKGQPTGTMNPGADASYAFIEAVMKDVAIQFPASPYVHLGADEVGRGGWDKDPRCQELMVREKIKNGHGLYVYFVNRAVAIARKFGKKSIAWDEAFDPGNDPELIIMSWRGMAPGIAAAKAGRTVIMCPNPPLYINHANTRSINNPRAYSAHLTYMNQGYFVYPDSPAIPAANRSQIMGAEVCLWSECVTDSKYMFTHVFPRACALAENLWLPRERLDWEGYLKRLELHYQRMDAMGIPYFREPETLPVTIASWKPGELAARKGVMEIPLKPLAHAGEQEFFVAQTTGEGQFRIEAVELLKDGVVVDTDRHRHDSSVYVNVDSLYVVSNPDTTGAYSIRIHAIPLFGDCAALVQHIPALAADRYSKQCAPGTGANRTKQNPPPKQP